MKRTATCFKRLAPLAASLLLPALAFGGTILFEDDFDSAVADEQPTIPPWAIMTAPDLQWGNYIFVRQDWENVFGQGTDNKYMEFHGTDAAMEIRGEFLESDAEVVTFSFDFFEPDGGKDQAMILFVYGPDGTSRAERLRLTHGGLGASAPLPGDRVYQLDTVNRLDWVINNSEESLTYLGGLRTIDSDRADVWINGNLVASNVTYESNTALGPVRAMDIRTFGNTSNQHVLIDNVEVRAGAHVSLSDVASAPLVEFLFNGNLLNTGSLGGEGSFIHPREETEGWVFENRPSIGVGLSGQPGTGLDNTQVSRMGSGTSREGVMVYQPGTGLHSLQSITITGWFNAEEPWQGNAHMVSKPNALHAYAGATRIAFEPFLAGSSPLDNRRETSSATPWQQEANRWIFFALTFDGTTDVSNVAFYRGYEDPGSFQLDVMRSKGPIGSIRNVGAELAIGNSFFGANPFKGRVDNIRVFGSTEDGSGALSYAALASIWAQDLEAASGVSPTLPEVRIVDMSHDGNNFSVSFETESGFTYVVESSTDLVDWSDVQYTVEGDGTVKEHTDTVSGVERRFYRVRVEQN